MLKIIRKHLSLLCQRLNLVAHLSAENIALRQQLIVLRRNQKRPQIIDRDRVFWVLLSRSWSGWRNTLYIVQPDTVVRWHKRAFKLYWRYKFRLAQPGRPPIDADIKALVLKLADANSLWGAPRIHGELLKLGIEVSERTVSGLLRRHRPKPSSQTWRTFIRNHMPDLVAVDFLVVPTFRFRMLFVFVVMCHHQRRVIHFNVTSNPTATGLPNRLLKPFNGILHPDIYSGIETKSMVQSFDEGSRIWASKRC